MRVAVALLLLLPACTSRTQPEPPPAPAAVPEPPPDTRETRAEAAGLDDGDAERLDSLGVPVYVPALPVGWTLTDVEVDDAVEGEVRFPGYTLHLQTDEGRCLAVLAASEGLGDVFLGDPPHEREVRVRGVPTTGPVRLGWGVAGETDEGWEDGRVATEWFGTDGLYLSVQSRGDEGCRPASPEGAETLLTTLRPLDPADDAILLGPTAPVDMEPADAVGTDPEALAVETFGPAESGEGRPRTAVETLRLRPRSAVVLVTTTGLADDSVRDERTRVVLTRGAEGWSVTAAGRQVRCQQGRGHSAWSAEPCA